MTSQRTHRCRALGTVVGLAMLAGPVNVAPVSADDGTSAARRATAGYHDISAATADGFGELRDKDGIACIDNPSGAMGIHYVLGSRVGDPSEDVKTPEALIYEPQKNGRLRLVGLEYVVLQSHWEGTGHTAPPSLFGQTFELIPAGNRYDLPPFYALHAWIWKHNPAGMFADWNPTVSCASG